MASAKESHIHSNDPGLGRFLQSISSNFLSLFTINNNGCRSRNSKPKTTNLAPLTSDPLSIISYSSAPLSASSTSVCLPFPFADTPSPPILPLFTATLSSSSSSSSSSPSSSWTSNYSDSLSSIPEESSSSSSSAAINSMSSSASGFPSTVRIAGLNSSAKGGGPAFVGQVFSMCDLSGTGLMAVSTHIEIPFISKRTPEWMKKLFATVTKRENNGPVFRFFMDLGDAVTYVKRFNIPTGVVGACRLDLAFEHFKEKPRMFQFVPNKKQVKAANQLLKMTPKSNGRKKVHGVPVFTAQNLDIAIATTDGIKWYTPYFFDKNMLDNILEESVDQHFDTLIQNRHTQRRRDVVDDNLAAGVVEDNGDSLWEPPEVQEVLDEMGHPGIPLSVLSKAAEMQLLHAVDKVLLGNRWLRKATGIQPKFPYMVDSFEERSAASFLRATESTKSIANSEPGLNVSEHEWPPGNSELELQESIQGSQGQRRSYPIPFGDWFSNPWLKQQQKSQMKTDSRMEDSVRECSRQALPPSHLLPKITMVGISTGEAGNMSRANLKKTMEDLTKELEQMGQDSTSYSSELRNEDRDPLFVANVSDYYSSMAKKGSSRWVRAGNK